MTVSTVTALSRISIIALHGVWGRSFSEGMLNAYSGVWQLLFIIHVERLEEHTVLTCKLKADSLIYVKSCTILQIG